MGIPVSNLDRIVRSLEILNRFQPINNMPDEMSSMETKSPISPAICTVATLVILATIGSVMLVPTLSRGSISATSAGSTSPADQDQLTEMSKALAINSNLNADLDALLLNLDNVESKLETNDKRVAHLTEKIEADAAEEASGMELMSMHVNDVANALLSGRRDLQDDMVVLQDLQTKTASDIEENLEPTIDVLQRELASLQEQLKEMKEIQDMIYSEAADLTESVQTIQIDLTRNNRDATGLKADLAQLTEELDQAFTGTEEERSELRNDMRTLKRTVKKLMKRVNKLE